MADLILAFQAGQDCTVDSWPTSEMVAARRFLPTGVISHEAAGFLGGQFASETAEGLFPDAFHGGRRKNR